MCIFLIEITSVLGGSSHHEYSHAIPVGAPTISHMPSHAIPGYTTKEWGEPIYMSKKAVPKPVVPQPFKGGVEKVYSPYGPKHGKKKQKHHHYVPPPPPVHTTNQKNFEDSSIDIHVNVLNSAIPMQSQSQTQMQQQAQLQQLGQSQGRPGGIQGAGYRPPYGVGGIPAMAGTPYRPLLPAGTIPPSYGLPWVPATGPRHSKSEWVPGPIYSTNCRNGGKACLTTRRLLRRADSETE